MSALLTVAMLLSSCSLFSSEDPAEEAEWYNSPVLKPIFGDYKKTEKLYFSDSTEVEQYRLRGEYLATGAAACGTCHAKQGGAADDLVPLSGGRALTDSFGRVLAANITPDKETGIGEWNAAEIMRALRASIDREGRPLSLDVHRAYRWMSDRDAKAISIYLLQQPAVRSVVERRRLGGFQRNEFGLFPQHRDFSGYVPELPQPRINPDIPAEQNYDARWGRYLAHHVSQCYTCHTMDPGGALSGVPFAGGGAGRYSLFSLRGIQELLTPSSGETDQASLGLLSPEGQEIAGAEKMAEDPDQLAQPLVAEGDRFPVPGPNIRGGTGGKLGGWSMDDIVTYLSTGKIHGEERTANGDLCPWPAFSRMTAIDKRSIAAYLKQM